MNVYRLFGYSSGSPEPRLAMYATIVGILEISRTVASSSCSGSVASTVCG